MDSLESRTRDLIKRRRRTFIMFLLFPVVGIVLSLLVVLILKLPEKYVMIPIGFYAIYWFVDAWKWSTVLGCPKCNYPEFVTGNPFEFKCKHCGYDLKSLD